MVDRYIIIVFCNWGDIKFYIYDCIYVRFIYFFFVVLVFSLRFNSMVFSFFFFIYNILVFVFEFRLDIFINSELYMQGDFFFILFRGNFFLVVEV